MSDEFLTRSEYKRQQRQKQEQEIAPQPQKKPKKKRKLRFLRRLIAFLVTVAIIVGVIGGGVFAYYASSAPPLDEAKVKEEVHKGDNQIYVTADEIPSRVRNAFVAIEDARFYDHHGVDFIRFGGALLANVKGGFGAQGGSTITQQLVKNTLLSPEKTPRRKAQEMWLAIQMERHFSKQQILEMYVNSIYYPGNIYGVATASEKYYGKNLDDLKIHEAAMLAGMQQNPNGYDPRDHPQAAKNRRDQVLDAMAAHGYITADEAEQSKSVPVQATLQ